jgi:transposase
LGVAKSYRPVLRDQPMLLPVDMPEWLPGDHLVWFVLDTVDVLDVGEFERGRRGGAAAAGYDPRMLLGLLIYAYCHGVRSSRQVERLCHTDVAFRVLCAQDIPDHATIARFRAQHQDAFADLFSQVLMIAGRTGLARFGTVAIDGTKIAANASIDANRGQTWFAEQAATMIAEAEQADAIDNARTDQDENFDGDRMPPGLVDRSRRTERIREASRQLTERHRQLEEADHTRDAAARARLARSEAGLPVVGCIPKGPHHLAEARAHLARELRDHQAKLDRRAAIIASGKKPMGAPPVPTEQHSRIIRARRVLAVAEQAAQPGAAGDALAAAFKHRKPKNLPSVVVNTTDPDSRIMPTRKGFLQGYNAQVAVSADQVIVAVVLGQSTNDQACFVPMMRAAQQAATYLHTLTDSDDHLIGTVLADPGYAVDTNLIAPGPDRLIALGKGRDQSKAAAHEPADGPHPPNATARQAMQHRLRTESGRALYKRRGATVEPAIGNLKANLTRFSRRGLNAALGELHLAASAFNLMKIYRAANT